MTDSPALAEELTRRLPERCLLPGDPEFTGAVTGHNVAVTHRPDVIVRVRQAAEVAVAVQVANAAGARVHVQNSGHGATAPFVGGVLVDPAGLDRVSVGAGLLTVGGGVTWGTAVGAAAADELAPMAGTSPTVGVAGYTLGGGNGPLSRAYGWSSDQLTAAEVVTGDGMVRIVDAGHDPDLFWALRGGKWGLGVVTAMTFRPVDSPAIHGGHAFFDGADVAAVLRRYVTVAAELPATVSTSVTIARMPDLPFIPAPLRGRCTLKVRVADVDSPESATAWYRRVAGDAEPLIQDQASVHLSGWLPRFGDNVPPVPMWQAGRLLGPLGVDAADALLGVAGPDVDVPLLQVEVRQMGGRLAAAADDAVGGRDADFLVSVLGAPDPALFAVAVPGAADAVFTALAPWSHGGTQANFHGLVDDAHPATAAWSSAQNERLAAVRDTYDPGGVLH